MGTDVLAADHPKKRKIEHEPNERAEWVNPNIADVDKSWERFHEKEAIGDNVVELD